MDLINGCYSTNLFKDTKSTFSKAERLQVKLKLHEKEKKQPKNSSKYLQDT